MQLSRYGKRTDIVPLIREAASFTRTRNQGACWFGILTDGQTQDATAALAALKDAQDTDALFGVYGFGPFLQKVRSGERPFILCNFESLVPQGTTARDEMDALDNRVKRMTRRGWDSFQLAVVSDFRSVDLQTAARAAVAECVAELPKQLRFLNKRRTGKA